MTVETLNTGTPYGHIEPVSRELSEIGQELHQAEFAIGACRRSISSSEGQDPTVGYDRLSIEMSRVVRNSLRGELENAKKSQPVVPTITWPRG